MTKNRIVKFRVEYFPQYRTWWWPFWRYYETGTGAIIRFFNIKEARRWMDRDEPMVGCVDEW
jgi:hypothetical protein